MTIGHNTVLYQNQILSTVVVKSLVKLKYVFYKPLNAFSKLTECESQTKTIMSGQKRKAISGKGNTVAKAKAHVSVQK